ncbi:MAG: hypothetical protein ACOX5G_02555 [Kiritimatiellia bacterium]|jgi:hypothetical protein
MTTRMFKGFFGGDFVFRGCRLCAVVSLVLLLVGIFISPLTRSKETETKNIIRQVYALVEYVAFANGLSSEDLLSAQSETNTPALFLESITRQALSEGLAPPSLKNGTITDRWGRQLNVAWRYSLAENGDAKRLSQYPSIFVVWSSGNNGINEFGDGDDVSLPPHMFSCNHVAD